MKLILRALRHFLFVSCVSLLLSAYPLHAEEMPEQPANVAPIVFGQTAALEGPAAALGQGMRDGILAAFKEVNDNGGILGKTLELISYDDGYEPGKAIENTHKLIEEDKVFALIGGVGTPTANAVEPIITREKVPFIGPFTGAEFLRAPFKRYVINIRGSYWQETESWIAHLTEDLGIKRIAILYQDDSYGRAGLSGVQRALGKRNMELVGEATYMRNTIAVKASVLALRKTKPEVVLMVGAYKPCAEFIKVSKRIGFNPKFVNISFVGSDALAKELGGNGAGVIISQVVPFPYDQLSSVLVKNYQRAMQAYDVDQSFGFVSLEGYMAGRFVAEILKTMNGPITREALLDKIYEMGDVKIDDLTLHFSKEDNQGMDAVFLTVLQKDGTFKPVEKLSR